MKAVDGPGPHPCKHLLTGEELSPAEIQELLLLAQTLKQERKNKHLRDDLKGLQLALLFDKPSLRTRFSFTIAMRELGGDVIESIADTRKKECPRDQAAVLSSYCHGIMIRTHEDAILEEMCQTASIPIFNGLSADHHPCQILSDFLTLKESFGKLEGLTISYLGDGNNILHSLLLLAPQLGIKVQYACPVGRGPQKEILQRSVDRGFSSKIEACINPESAVGNADAVYTDVWTSMGFEANRNEDLFHGYQVNEDLMKLAKENAIFMHCLPMERGKEVSETLPDAPCSVIYRQSENRLHMQKALLLSYLGA